MLRTALRSAIKPRAPPAGAARRSASTVSETVGDAAQKVKDAASQATSGHHKPSSDVPWAIGSLLVFAPTLFYLTAPPSKDAGHHEKPKKEKYKATPRMPDPNAYHYKIPEELGDKAGEGRPLGDGDHGLRAEQSEEDHEHTMKQNSPEPAASASNHDAKAGLKGDSGKFNAAARGSQQLNQIGGAEAARDPKTAVAAARAASADHEDKGHNSQSTPSTTAHHVGSKLTEKREATPDAEREEKDAQDPGNEKDELSDNKIETNIAGATK